MNNDAHQVLRVYSVVASEPDNDRWLEIGKASPHQDGRGFDLVLEALPMNSRLVVRAQEETQAGAESAAEQRASYAQQIAAFERTLIERCLTETGGSISGVMERLSIRSGSALTGSASCKPAGHRVGRPRPNKDRST
jgi:hypothetical protein